MTLVNAETGEIVTDYNAIEARIAVDRIKVGVEGVWHLVIDAYRHRAWLALGYASWDDLVTREFGTCRLRLPREERQEVVASLHDAGFSLRAIAAVTGDSVTTVRRGLAGVPNGTPDDDEHDAPPDDEPVADSAPTTTGTDGKTYQRKQKAAPDKSRAAVEARVARIRELAAEGYTSRQIASTVDLSVSGLKLLCDRECIEVPADAVVGKTHVHNADRIVSEMTTTLEALAMSVDLVDHDDIDPAQIEDWATSLSDSLKTLNRFCKQLKEMTQ